MRIKEQFCILLESKCFCFVLIKLPQTWCARVCVFVWDWGVCRSDWGWEKWCLWHHLSRLVLWILWNTVGVCAFDKQFLWIRYRVLIDGCSVSIPDAICTFKFQRWSSGFQDTLVKVLFLDKWDCSAFLSCTWWLTSFYVGLTPAVELREQSIGLTGISVRRYLKALHLPLLKGHLNSSLCSVLLCEIMSISHNSLNFVIQRERQL